LCFDNLKITGDKIKILLLSSADNKLYLKKDLLVTFDDQIAAGKTLSPVSPLKAAFKAGYQAVGTFDEERGAANGTSHKALAISASDTRPFYASDTRPFYVAVKTTKFKRPTESEYDRLKDFSLITDLLGESLGSGSTFVDILNHSHFVAYRTDQDTNTVYRTIIRMT